MLFVYFVFILAAKNQRNKTMCEVHIQKDFINKGIVFIQYLIKF